MYIKIIIYKNIKKIGLYIFYTSLKFKRYVLNVKLSWKYRKFIFFQLKPSSG